MRKENKDLFDLINVIVWMIASLIFILALSSCSVIKNIKKDKKTEQHDSKTDSSSVTKNDITKESKITTEVTEEVDTTVTKKGFTISDSSEDLKKKPIVINQDGFTAIVYDSSGVTKIKATKADDKIKVRIKKKTKTSAAVKEEDKTKTKKAVKNQDSKKSTAQTTTKDIKKSFVLPWWLWLILLALGLLYLLYRYLKTR